MGRATAGEGYTITDHLLLGVIDALNVSNWQRGNAGKPRHQQRKPPQPMRRPGKVTVKYRVGAEQLKDFQRRTSQPSQPASKQD